MIKLINYQIVRKCNSIRNYSNITPLKSNRSHLKKSIFLSTIIGTVVYDGVINDFQFCGATERFLRSLKIGLQIVADYKWNLRGVDEFSPDYDDLLKVINQRCADRILDGCLANGGLYIKIGQGVSAINHILPKEYTQTLKKLHNECLHRRENEVKQVFLDDFGLPPEEMFKEFDYKPVACASLAQVFKATTHDGEEVAVKVQYIDLQKRFPADIGTILFLQNMFGLVFKDYNFSWIINDVRKNLLQELDFKNEARNVVKCAEDLKKFDFIHIPTIRWDLTTHRILTAEFIEGCKINETDVIKAQNLDLKDIDMKLFKTFAEQIFNTGFVHADPHPGNIFVRKGKNGKAELVILDHGLYQTVSYENRQSLCHFWEAIVLKDHKNMKKYADELNVGGYKRLAEVLLQKPLESKGAKFTSKLTDEDIAYMTKIAKERFNDVMSTLSDMPRSMLFVVRNLNTVRAIAREHGDPVDRLAVMARYAVSCIYREKGGFFRFFYWLNHRIRFEYYLMKSSIQFWAVTSYLRFLTKIGRSPDTKELFEIGVEEL